MLAFSCRATQRDGNLRRNAGSSPPPAAFGTHHCAAFSTKKNNFTAIYTCSATPSSGGETRLSAWSFVYRCEILSARVTCANLAWSVVFCWIAVNNSARPMLLELQALLCGRDVVSYARFTRRILSSRQPRSLYNMISLVQHRKGGSCLGTRRGEFDVQLRLELIQYGMPFLPTWIRVARKGGERDDSIRRLHWGAIQLLR